MQSKIVAIAVAALVIGVGGGFYAGTVYQKSKTPAVGSFRGSGRNLGEGQNHQPSQVGRNFVGRQTGANGGGFIAGEIVAKDDNSITVKTRDGGSSIVYFSDSTSVGKAVNGSADDLQTGQQVTIGGKANQDGTFAAQNIQVRPDVINQTPSENIQQ